MEFAENAQIVEQGDVFLVFSDPNTNVPYHKTFDFEKAEKVSHGTVAYGEHSGHHHVLMGKGIDLYTYKGEQFVVDRGQGGILAHVDENTGSLEADHKAINFPVDGKVRVYKRHVQREFDGATQKYSMPVHD